MKTTFSYCLCLFIWTAICLPCCGNVFAQEKSLQGTSSAEVSPFKQTIEINPLRLFEGNFQLSYDRKISDKWSLNLSGIGTYASQKGYGGEYLNLQKEMLSYSNGGYYYSPQMITGWGAMAQVRNFLFTGTELPLGLYAAPFLMYRKVWVTSRGYGWESDRYVEKDHTRNLDIFEGGVLLGGRIAVIKKIYSIDINAGAGMRLSKYYDEKHFTRYRNWKALDYSGVLPTVGVSIGILK